MGYLKNNIDVADNACRGGAAMDEYGDYRLEIGSGCYCSPKIIALVDNMDAVLELLVVTRHDSPLANLVLNKIRLDEARIEKEMEESSRDSIAEIIDEASKRLDKKYEHLEETTTIIEETTTITEETYEG